MCMCAHVCVCVVCVCGGGGAREGGRPFALRPFVTPHTCKNQKYTIKKIKKKRAPKSFECLYTPSKRFGRPPQVENFLSKISKIFNLFHFASNAILEALDVFILFWAIFGYVFFPF